MTIKDWFIIRKEEQIARRTPDVRVDDSVKELWAKCFNCSNPLTKKELEAHLYVCPHCDYHFRIDARARIEQLIDGGTFEEMFTDIMPTDPLDFEDTEKYSERLRKAKAKTNLNDAVICGVGEIDGEKVSLAVMDFEYMGGSMGSVVGEKVTLAIEEAIKRRIPMIAVTASGGARMQESALSLMQMAKTSCAVSRMNENKLLYMTILTEPTFGGVTASFGTIGDIVIAEQGARIGFAGRRVIEQTIRQKLPADFQTAEYLLKYGLVDLIAKRSELKRTVSKLLKIHK